MKDFIATVICGIVFAALLVGALSYWSRQPYEEYRVDMLTREQYTVEWKPCEYVGYDADCEQAFFDYKEERYCYNCKTEPNFAENEVVWVGLFNGTDLVIEVQK